MDNQLISLLQEANFTEKEAKVYLTLLELGSADIAEISHRSELKRTIIYVIIESLAKRGYVSEIPNLKVKKYSAADPSKIYAQINTVARTFKEMLPYFRSIYNKSDNKPKIQFFDTIPGIISVYREISEYNEAYFVSSISKLRAFIPDEVDAWISGFQKTASRQTSKHILENTPEDTSWGQSVKSFGHEVRILAPEKQIDMDLSIYGGRKVAITSLTESRFVVVIESEPLFKSMKLLFDLSWETALPLE